MEKIVVPAIMLSFVSASVVPRIIQKIRKVDPVGRIGINRGVFTTGKLALFISLVMIPIHTFVTNLAVFRLNGIFKWTGLAFLGIGVVVFILAVISLGSVSLRMGLAREGTELRTRGIYGVSRNPMLLGLFIMVLGSALYVPNPINWAAAIMVILIHHHIILTEEKFLAERFSNHWAVYAGSVKRYL